MKFCSLCKIKKYFHEFHKNKSNKDGYHGRCKECRTIESSQHRQKHSEKLKNKSRLHYKNNKESILNQQNEHYQNNKKEINDRRRKARWDNHDQAIVKERKNRVKNKAKIDEWNKLYASEKRYSKTIKERERKKQKDPEYKLITVLRKRVPSLVKRSGFIKSGSAVKDLGCTPEQFLEYLETKFYQHPITKENMSWDNYGRGPGKWQVDHIKAIRFFNVSDRDQFLIAFNFKNMQPLWHEDHAYKSNEERRLANFLKKY